MGSGGRRKKDRGIVSIPRAKRIVTAREGAMLTAAPQNGGSSQRTRAKEQCQRFALVHVTNAARDAGAGMAISGIFEGPKVKIRSQVGELGDAPSQAARFFIEQRDLKGGGVLKGHILKHTPSEIRVKLCLN